MSKIIRDINRITTICPFCREGIPYMEMNGQLQHLDIFATSDAGEFYPCFSRFIIRKYIKNYRKNGSPIFEDEFEELIEKIGTEYDEYLDQADNKLNKYVDNEEQDSFTKEELLDHLSNIIEHAFKQGNRYQIR